MGIFHRNRHMSHGRKDIGTPIFLEMQPAQLACVLVAFLVMQRCPDIFFRSGLWAEDGTVFFKEALEKGFISIFQPIGGHYMFASRLCAWLGVLFPVRYTPYVYAFLSLALSTASLCYFVSKDFSAIISETEYRILVVVLAAIGPGGFEVFGNLCNLHAPLFILASLLTFVESQRVGDLSHLRKLLFVFIAFSSAECILLIPVILYLLFKKRGSKLVFPLVVFVGVTLLNVWQSHQWAIQKASIDQYKVTQFSWTLKNFWILIQMYFERVFIHLVYTPLVGVEKAHQLMLSSWSAFWTVSILTAIYAFNYFKRLYGAKSIFNAITNPFVIITFGVIWNFVLISVVRPFNFELMQRMAGNEWSVNRYSFLPCFYATTCWVALSRFLARLNKLVPALFLVTIIIFQIAQVWQMSHVRFDTDWESWAQEIEYAFSNGKTGVVIKDIPLNPPGWKFDLVVP